MKQFYQVPSIKVVSFKVEEGFASLNVGDQTVPKYGTSEVKTNLETDTWTGSVFNG